jgi:hypothetical protein
MLAHEISSGLEDSASFEKRLDPVPAVFAADTTPWPVTIFNRPFGRPASCRASTNTCVCSELNSLGLTTTAQPAAMAEASLRQINNIFTSYGEIGS